MPQLKYFSIGLCLCFVAPYAQAARDGELWEVGSQVSKDGGSLGPMTINKLCFPINKNFQEPPEKDDPNCKTDVKASGKKTTFKSVCKDSDGTTTSTGVSEELGAYHYKSDITITQEMRGEPRLQQRQVGYVKRIGTSCDSQAMFKGFGGAALGSTGSSAGAAQAASDSEGGSAPVVERTRDSSEDLSKNSSGTEEQQAGKKSEGITAKDAVEAGKSLLRGILKF